MPCWVFSVPRGQQCLGWVAPFVAQMGSRTRSRRPRAGKSPVVVATWAASLGRRRALPTLVLDRGAPYRAWHGAVLSLKVRPERAR